MFCGVSAKSAVTQRLYEFARTSVVSGISTMGLSLKPVEGMQ